MFDLSGEEETIVEKPSERMDRKPENTHNPPGISNRPTPQEAERILQEAAKRSKEIAAERAAHVLPAAVVPVQTPPVAADAWEEREARRRVEALIASAGVPKRFREADAINFSARLPASVVKPYSIAMARLMRMKDESGTVALLGPRGPGKTWMASAMVLHFCRSRRYALFSGAWDFFQRCREVYTDGSKDRLSGAVAHYLKPDLLVLDEIDIRSDSPFEDVTLTVLINKRYAEEKSTILISNQSVAAFRDRIGLTIFDRLADGGDVIECPWGSLRGHLLPPGEAA